MVRTKDALYQILNHQTVPSQTSRNLYQTHEKGKKA